MTAVKSFILQAPEESLEVASTLIYLESSSVKEKKGLAARSGLYYKTIMIINDDYK
jgi:hypothetical protein